MPYAWDFPAARDKKILLIIGSSRRVVDIMEIGDLMPFKFTVRFFLSGVRPALIVQQTQQRSKAVSLDVRADGQTQILRITNYNSQRSLYKPRHRASTMAISRQDTISSTVEAFEAVPEEVSPNYTLVVDLAGVGVSLVNKKMVEVIYLLMDAIKFEYTNSLIAQSVNLSCGNLQIDNQLHEALYPVILQPTPIAKETSAVGALPTVQGSIIWLKDQGWVLPSPLFLI
jgi:vacuolar protein sorting-associated protein 13A/C